MLPFRHDLSVYRGDTIRVVVRLWSDKEQTIPFIIDAVMAFTAQIRPAANDPTFTDFEVTPEVGGSSVTLNIDPDVCRTLPDNGEWDMQIDYLADNTLVQTPVAGTVTVTSDVTRVGALRGTRRV